MFLSSLFYPFAHRKSHAAALHVQTGKLRKYSRREAPPITPIRTYVSHLLFLCKSEMAVVFKFRYLRSCRRYLWLEIQIFGHDYPYNPLQRAADESATGAFPWAREEKSEVSQVALVVFETHFKQSRTQMTISPAHEIPIHLPPLKVCWYQCNCFLVTEREILYYSTRCAGGMITKSKTACLEYTYGASVHYTHTNKLLQECV